MEASYNGLLYPALTRIDRGSNPRASTKQFMVGSTGVRRRLIDSGDRVDDLER